MYCIFWLFVVYRKFGRFSSRTAVCKKHANSIEIYAHQFRIHNISMKKKLINVNNII